MKNISLQPEQLLQPLKRIVRYEQQTKALPVCDILIEINKLNDKVLADLLGALDFDHINIQYYNVDILDAVSADNVLTFFSNASFYGNDAIEVKMVIKQQTGNVEKTIVNGNFIYIVRQRKSEKLLQQFFKLINTTDYGIKTWGRSTRL